MIVTHETVRNVLTRAGGYLHGIASHSVQPYRGCGYGNSLCGVGCYARHNPWITRGAVWGGFLGVRTGAADAYRTHAARERRWARAQRDGFVVFLSSSTDPFPPHERAYGVTRALLAAMAEDPPDGLIVQTHGNRVLDHVDQLVALAAVADARVHVSIESDRDRLPGLPPPAASVAARLEAAARLREAGLRTVITVAPLLPIADPDAFFARCAAAADAIVLDHFVGGDGTADGGRTRRTALPAAIAAVDPAALDVGYRDRMAAISRRHLPVGLGAEGFAGVFAPRAP